MKVNNITTNINAPNMHFKDIFGEELTDAAAIADLQSHPYAYQQYLSMEEEHRMDLLNFIKGKESLCIIYDNFFKKLMSPTEHRERFEDFISALLGSQVKVLEVLSPEGLALSEKGSFVIMDIIVELIDGSIVNVEMQKLGYSFSGQRSECYIADSIMRQYNRERSRLGKKFSYSCMKPSHLIILMERSSKEFLDVAPDYIHIREVSYNTHARINSIENIRYISLDTFNAVMQNKDINNDLEAWLTFLSCKDMVRIEKLVNAFPKFKDLYREINDFRKDPEELIGMFSEALRMTDHYTELYMIDEIQKEADALRKEADSLKKETDSLKKETDSLKKETDSLKKENSDLEAQISSRDMEIAELKAQLSKLEGINAIMS